MRTVFWYLLASVFLLAFPAWGAVEVVDAHGDKLVLPSAATRIVSLAPNITETLFALDAGDLIVGADEYSNYPEAAKKITRVNNYQAANYELILALKPDVVLAWQSGNGDQIIARLRQLGLPVFVIEPRTLTDIATVLKQFGKITGHEQKAKQEAGLFVTRLDALAQTYSGAREVSVFYQIWNEPLITLNGKHLVSDVIRLCGGRNVFAEAGPLVPYVNIEAVLQADPEVIIASGSSGDNPQWLQMWKDWPSIEAVKNHRVFSIPPDLMQRHSLRIVEGTQQVCQFLDKAR